MTSDWKDRANKRRDERNTKVSDEYKKPKAAKKDTTKWCKGKVGREHTPKCVLYNRFIKTPPKWYNLCCTTCGKVLDRYWPCSWDKDSKIKPDWVTKDERPL